MEERKLRKKKSKQLLKYDGLTEQMRGLLERIPRIGSQLSRLYLWKHMLFNFMLIGATGTVLNWFLYEFIFRPNFVFFGGSLLAFVCVTALVFLWNYFWNWRFSLSMEAQVASMKKNDLLGLQERVAAALSQDFDAKGERIHEN